MSDDTWASYTSEEAVVADVSAAVPASPAVEEAATDAWQGDLAGSWADWNAESAADAVSDATAEVDYAIDSYAGGFQAAGDAALARADTQYSNAADHSATAADYDARAASEYDTAVDTAAAPPTFTANFTKNHGTNIRLLVRGNPGPWPTFSVRRDPQVVPHFSIID